jgi:hypothetical protein
VARPAPGFPNGPRGPGTTSDRLVTASCPGILWWPATDCACDEVCAAATRPGDSASAATRTAPASRCPVWILLLDLIVHCLPRPDRGLHHCCRLVGASCT